jgi:hypothetical protein
MYFLTHEPQGIPADWPLAAMWSDLDYGFAEIGGQRFLLPLHAALNLRWRNGGQARNTTDFHNYRKFTTEATLKFEP